MEPAQSTHSVAVLRFSMCAKTSARAETRSPIQHVAGLIVYKGACTMTFGHPPKEGQTSLVMPRGTHGGHVEFPTSGAKHRPLAMALSLLRHPSIRGALAPPPRVATTAVKYRPSVTCEWWEKGPLARTDMYIQACGPMHTCKYTYTHAQMPAWPHSCMFIGILADIVWLATPSSVVVHISIVSISGWVLNY